MHMNSISYVVRTWCLNTRRLKCVGVCYRIITASNERWTPTSHYQPQKLTHIHEYTKSLPIRWLRAVSFFLTSYFERCWTLNKLFTRAASNSQWTFSRTCLFSQMCDSSEREGEWENVLFRIIFVVTVQLVFFFSWCLINVIFQVMTISKCSAEIKRGAES